MREVTHAHTDAIANALRRANEEVQIGQSAEQTLARLTDRLAGIYGLSNRTFNRRRFLDRTKPSNWLVMFSQGRDLYEIEREEVA